MCYLVGVVVVHSVVYVVWYTIINAHIPTENRVANSHDHRQLYTKSRAFTHNCDGVSIR